MLGRAPCSAALCPSLSHVDREECKALHDISDLAGAFMLSVITAAQSAVRTIGQLFRCPRLQRIVLRDCMNLSSLEGLAGAPCLKDVDASCSAVTALDPLSSCLALRRVSVFSCTKLKSTSALAGATSLSHLNAGNSGVETLGNLARCPSLETAGARNCQHLSSLDGLGGATALRKLIAEDSAIKTINGLGECVSLQKGQSTGLQTCVCRLEDLPSAKQLTYLLVVGTRLPQGSLEAVSHVDYVDLRAHSHLVKVTVLRMWQQLRRRRQTLVCVVFLVALVGVLVSTMQHARTAPSYNMH